MKQMVHILPQKGHNCLGCVDRWAWESFCRDDAPLGSNLADAPERCYRLLQIYATVE